MNHNISEYTYKLFIYDPEPDLKPLSSLKSEHSSLKINCSDKINEDDLTIDYGDENEENESNRFKLSILRSYNTSSSKEPPNDSTK